MYEDVDEKLSRQFRSMSFLCACLVVVLHAAVEPMQGSWQWWLSVVFLRDGLCCVAVPYFFLASGFFLAGHMREPGWYWHAVCRRVRSLMGPFFIWTAVTIAVNGAIRAAIWAVDSDCRGDYFELPSLSIGWIAAALGLNPFKDVGASVWYLRTLFLFVVISPALLMLMSRRWMWQLPLVTLLVYSVWDMCGVRNANMRMAFGHFFSLQGLFFFSLGIFLRRVGISEMQSRRFAFCAAAGLGLMFANGVCALNGIDSAIGLMKIAMILSAMGFLWFLSGRFQIGTFLSAAAFPVYLMHAYFIWVAWSVFAALGLSAFGEGSLLAMAARFAFALTGSLGMTWILRRFFPRVSSIAFGGR